MPRFFFTPIRMKAQLLLMRATNALPREQQEWGHAVISELNEISGFWPCLEWIVGGMTAMSKAALHNVLHNFLPNILTGAGRKQPGQEPPYATAAGIGFILLLVPFYFVSASLLNQWGIPWFFAPAIVVLLGIYDHGVRDARWRPEEIHRRLTSQRLSQISG